MNVNIKKRPERIELKNIFDYLNKAGCEVKSVIKFSAPADCVITVAEAEARAEFYPQHNDENFITLLNGCNFAELKNGGRVCLILKGGSENFNYIVFYLNDCFYALAFAGAASALETSAGGLKLALRLCLDFYLAEAASDIEPMTKLFNHGYFQRELRCIIAKSESEWEWMRRNDPPLEYDSNKANVAMILFDIDNFKNFNDTYGHHTGDAVIKAVAAAALKEILKYGGGLIAARYGGEEFAVIAPGLSRAKVVELAENIRAAVEAIDGRAVAKEAGTALKICRVTASFGAAFHEASSASAFEGDSEDKTDKCARELVKKADLALYGSKQLGKNRVTEYESLPYLCLSVMERRGDFILLNGGSAQGVDYNDRFEVYDSLYNGSSDIINPATSKKIGCYPRLLKGVISVSKELDRFDSIIMEKVSVCRVEKEIDGIAIGANDICVPIGRAEKEIYSGDLFCSRDLFDAVYYRALEPENISALSAYRSLMLVNIKNLVDRIVYNRPEKLKSIISEIKDAAVLSGLKFDGLHMLSTDKIMACFKKEFNQAAAGNFVNTINQRFKSIFGDDAPPVRLSALNAGLLLKNGVCRGDLLRFLRIADFVNSFYKNPRLIEEFDYQTYRKYGLYKYYCADYEKALDIFSDCEKLFKYPPDFRLYQNIGSLALKLNKTGLALKYFLMAEKLDGSSAVPKANLALVYSLKGACEKAVGYYAQCLELEPDNAQYNNNMAHNLLLLNKRLKYALKCVKKAIDNCSPAQLPPFLDTLADIYAASGEFKSAVEIYKREIRLYKLNAPLEIYFKLALALVKSNERTLALKTINALKSCSDYINDAPKIAEYEKIIRNS
jgi:diguanylate cyclase (GGDEF)-like protein